MGSKDKDHYRKRIAAGWVVAKGRGERISEYAQRVGVPERTISSWVRRFLQPTPDTTALMLESLERVVIHMQRSLAVALKDIQEMKVAASLEMLSAIAESNSANAQEETSSHVPPE